MLYFILSVLLVVSITINVFLILSIKKALFYIEILESWIVDFRNLIKNTYNKLKSVDDRHIFEKDDDVGFLFSELLNILATANDTIKDDIKNDNTGNKSDNEKENQIQTS